MHLLSDVDPKEQDTILWRASKQWFWQECLICGHCCKARATEADWWVAVTYLFTWLVKARMRYLLLSLFVCFGEEGKDVFLGLPKIVWMGALAHQV